MLIQFLSSTPPKDLIVDMSIIGTTHRHRELEAPVEHGMFRQDCRSRLWYAALELPLLRVPRSLVGLQTSAR